MPVRPFFGWPEAVPDYSPPRWLWGDAMSIYPGAIWKGPVPNVGGVMGPVRLGVIHIMEGTLAGTDSWFHDPNAQVSAHLGVGKDGAVYQWVDTSRVAWAEANYNGEAISIEHEGNSGDSLTPQQIAADIPLIRWLNQTSGIPFAMTDANGSGWVGHGQLGAAGGSHPNCPGQAILDQWPGVLAAAQGSPPVPPPPPIQEANMIARNTHGSGYWCVRPTGAVYAFQGAPALGPAQHFLTSWGIGTPECPIVGIADDGQGGFTLMADANKYPGQPALYGITADGKYKA